MLAVQNVSHLLYPNVEVNLSAIDDALSQHIPSLELNQRLKSEFVLQRLRTTAAAQAQAAQSSMAGLTCRSPCSHLTVHLTPLSTQLGQAAVD